MKSALVTPQTSSYEGWRVAQVEPQDQTFPVGDPFFWTDCPDEAVADYWYYNTTTQTVLQIPPPPPPVAEIVPSSGTQTL